MYKVLIYGGGTIGSYLAACLYKKSKIYFITRENILKKIKERGLNVEVFKNKYKIKNYRLKKILPYENINLIPKNIKFDYIFITTKLNSDLESTLKKIDPYIGSNTTLIPPCTSIPFWFYLSLNKKYKEKFYRKLRKYEKKNIIRKNIVGMTMWLSGHMVRPGLVKISHIQRGFPLKEVFEENKNKTDILRKLIKEECPSPKVNNIFSEIFTKSLNSLSFNLIALITKKNNKELDNDTAAKKKILNIMNESEKILHKNNIRIYQSAENRIIQTLRSKTHTMSMLYSYLNNRKIEIYPLSESFLNYGKILNVDFKYLKKYISILKKTIKI